MPGAYRLIRANEIDSAADLWAGDHPDLDSEQHRAWRREFHSIPDHLTCTRVAVAEDGVLLSIVHYWRQDMRGADGSLQRVGRVSHVFTRPNMRRQGHAARLLELTIAAMRADGCRWSILATTDEGRPLYERYGWRPLPIRQTVCTFLGERPPLSDSYVVRPYDPVHAPDGWAAIAPIYDAYNAVRPLTIVRNAAYWRHYAIRVDRWLSAGYGAVRIARRAGDDRHLYPCAYVLAGFSAEYGVRLAELGALPRDEDALSPLLAVVASCVTERGMAGRPSTLPRDPQLREVLIAMCSGMAEQRDPDWMIRPSAPDVDAQALLALPDAPGAVLWLFDDV